MTEHCTYSDLPVATCHHCQTEPPVPKPKPINSHPFIANYSGTCAGCGFDIVAGKDRIAIRNDKTVHHDHRRCEP